VPVHNADVAGIFKRVADLLAIEGANEFRVRAYRDAARTIETLARPVAEMVEEGEDLSELEAVGEDLAGKIEEIVETGGLTLLQEIEARTPPSLADLLIIEGLGPKRVQALYEALGVTTLDELEEVAQQGRVRGVEGFGEKTEQRILDEMDEARGRDKRTRLDVADELAQSLVDYLRGAEGVERVTVAGSYRRRKETVGDLDILVTAEDGGRISEHFVQFEDVEDVFSQGETRSTVRLRQGIDVDLRVVAAESYGAALLYFTGSKAHNIHLRNMALNQNLKVNEYGVFKVDEGHVNGPEDGRGGEGERVAGEREEEIYDLFGLAYVEPEMREDRGEIEAAQEGNLPHLITLDHVRGDLQSHTKASDGRHTMEKMARAARDRGHDYLAITDHSQHMGVTQGLDADEVAERIEVIAALDEELDEFRLLAGVEVDILEDGSLALPDDLLRRLDVVICAVHTSMDLPEEQQTERILRALDNPHVHVLAHPTGRRIGERPPMEMDMERVMEAALERGCYLEVNAQPDRLDLDDAYCKMAKEMGLKVAISTDAHRAGELAYLRYGVGQARRGWLEPADVINARAWDGLKQLLAR